MKEYRFELSQKSFFQRNFQLIILNHRMGGERNVYKVLMEKSEGKRALGRPRRGWENWIKMDLREIGWGSVDWIQLAQDRDRWRAVVNTVMNFQVLAPRSCLLFVCFFVC
jgi:hypothetical protein